MESFPSLIRSLRNTNYRRFYIGQSISMIGTFMQFGAIPWVVWELTHAAWWLGAANFASQIPFLFFGLLGGAVSDRTSRRPLIFVMQLLLLFQAIALAALMTTHHLHIMGIVALVFLSGAINSVDFPARLAFAMDLVGPKDLVNAIALNAGLVHSMRIVGPVLAGWVLYKWGAAWCFGINAASYIAVLLALALLNPAKMRPQQFPKRQHIFKDVREGFHLVRTTPELRRPLLMLAIISLIAGSYMAFLPYFADRVYGRGPKLLGYLMGASALGALCGAAVLAQLVKQQLDRWITVGGFLLSMSLVAFSQTTNLVIGIPALFGVGFGMLLIVSGIHTLVQLRAPEHARGRVVGYVTSAFFGLAPIGGLAIGSISHYIGVPLTLGLSGAATFTYILFDFVTRRNGTIS